MVRLLHQASSAGSGPLPATAGGQVQRMTPPGPVIPRVTPTATVRGPDHHRTVGSLTVIPPAVTRQVRNTLSRRPRRPEQPEPAWPAPLDGCVSTRNRKVEGSKSLLGLQNRRSEGISGIAHGAAATGGHSLGGSSNRMRARLAHYLGVSPIDPRSNEGPPSSAATSEVVEDGRLGPALRDVAGVLTTNGGHRLDLVGRVQPGSAVSPVAVPS